MNKKIFTNKIKRYFKRTYENKLVALALIALGFMSISFERDATFLVMTLIFGIPLFFDKKNWID